MKKPFYKKWWFILIVALFVIGAIAGGGDKKEDAKKDNTTNQEESAKKEVSTETKENKEQAKEEDKLKEEKAEKEEKKKNKDEDLADKAKKIITDKLGKKNNQKKDTVKSYAVTNEDNGKGFIVQLNANENFSVNMTKKGMWMDSKKILEPLSKMNDFEKVKVHWYYPLVDTYGNEKDVLVMSFDIDKATLNKIKWDNFLTDNVPKVVNNYFEHAALKE